MTFQTYKDTIKKIKSYNTNIKEKIGCAIFSFIASAIIIILPLFILINSLIFRDYVKYIIIMFGFLTWFMYFISRSIYLQGITKGFYKKTYMVALFESIVLIPLIIIIVILVIILGGF